MLLPSIYVTRGVTNFWYRHLQLFCLQLLVITVRTFVTSLLEDPALLFLPPRIHHHQSYKKEILFSLSLISLFCKGNACSYDIDFALPPTLTFTLPLFPTIPASTPLSFYTLSTHTHTLTKKHKEKMTPETTAKLKKQLEFYFSDWNYGRDKYLRARGGDDGRTCKLCTIPL